MTPLQNNNHLLELPSTFVYVVKLNIQELLQSSIISATSQVIFSKLHNITLNAKAKQIKLIVSQAFFLGKPMRDAAFFVVVANHNHN